ncbi:MAG: hypothetical protein ACE10E_00930 [Acidiferrobacterales bacterium]
MAPGMRPARSALLSRPLYSAAERGLDAGHQVRAIEMDRARHGRLIEHFLWPEIDDQQALVAEMWLELVRLHN